MVRAHECDEGGMSGSAAGGEAERVQAMAALCGGPAGRSGSEVAGATTCFSAISSRDKAKKGGSLLNAHSRLNTVMSPERCCGIRCKRLCGVTCVAVEAGGAGVARRH